VIILPAPRLFHPPSLGLYVGRALRKRIPGKSPREICCILASESHRWLFRLGNTSVELSFEAQFGSRLTTPRPTIFLSQIRFTLRSCNIFSVITTSQNCGACYWSCACPRTTDQILASSYALAFLSTPQKMFHQPSNGSTTLPRGFRFHSNEEDRPQTPEPTPATELQPPSPPRPARLKVRRRNAPSYQTPTEQFLASVAAADVPIPTIEEPEAVAMASEDSEMLDSDLPSLDTSRFLSPHPRDFREVSPPKTPIPALAMEEGYSQHLDWSMGSATLTEDFPRPTSAMSNGSDCSDCSLYSGSRVSRRSEDGSCTSPESDFSDPFQFPSFSKGKGKALCRNENDPEATVLNKQLRSKTRIDAPWTKDQSAHLWATYLLYLQDPTVTPFRIGASCVPPQGVVHRVARVAKRRWKGPKIANTICRRSSRLTPRARGATSDKSGSITPTGESPKVYAQWPHSSNATRAHLRDLCKSKDSNPVRHHRHLQSRSPAPFTKQHRPHARPSESPCFTSFNTQDISMSLTTSTAESMQPDGPLAQLAASDESLESPHDSSFAPLERFRPLSFGKARGLTLTLPSEGRGRRLGSPFARTYGPSSSQTLDILGRPSRPRTQFNTVSRPYLRSPVQFEEPRSLNGTQKRRAQHSLEEELSPNGAVLRPSILDEQLFGTPVPGSQRRVRTRGFSLGDEVSQNDRDGSSSKPALGLFPKSPTAPSLSADAEISKPQTSLPQLLPSVTFDPPRLGSPFSESGPSQTFPRRLFPDASATIRRSAFATMHQTRRSIESFDFGEGPSLQSRLTNLDQQLKEIRTREAAAQRQNSQ
jgi:hypothetical protein